MLKGNVHSLMTGYVPYCQNAECPPRANPWSAGWWDNSHALWRPEAWWWDAACWPWKRWCVKWERSRQVDGIYLLYSDSLFYHHNWPITLFAAITLLLSQPTSRSEDPHQYWYCWLVLCHDSHDLLCLQTYVLCLVLFFVVVMSYHTFLLWLWWFCLLSAPLWFCCLHTPYCYLF